MHSEGICQTSSVSLYFTSLQGDQKKKGTDDALPTGISMFHE